MKPTENNYTAPQKSVISQLQDSQETKKVWQNPDKTKPDEEVQKPYAKPEEDSEKGSKQENDPAATPKIPTPQTKIGFKTSAEQDTDKAQEQDKQEEQDKQPEQKNDQSQKQDKQPDQKK